ncbi:hypothetical protein [Leptolyngbya sp. 'hensonii']|uniref:hypothetical protein n=1 Tax=Leptolyngbya sp. 'hensonii' TaxID=1922337 RepID=UPI000A928F63|nr:hypothetical protein [Leptolyngbya sp. 'hensonii']
MSNSRVADDTYDRGIVSAEVAARKEREGDSYKQLPDHEESLDTAGGYTVDREGLLNNFAVEPEMYYEVPGDLQEKEMAKKAERIEELKDVNEDKKGQLTLEDDQRGHGSGII